MHKLENLKVWNKAMDIACDVYKLSANFPESERFGLTRQIRGCAVSVPSNIAEGAGRNTEKQFINFLGISSGSAYELQTQLLLSYRLNIVEKSKIIPIIDDVIEVQKMNYALIKSLERKIKP